MKPRTCIVKSKELRATILPQYSSGDVTTVLLNIQNGNKNEEIIMSSVYMPFEEHNKMPDDMTRAVIAHSASSDIPITIGADCNAHHALWSSSDINRRGEKLVEYLSTTDLDIQNKACEPTFATKTRQEVLDITLATQRFANRIKNWRVSVDETFSHHREINFSIACEPQKGELTVTRETQIGALKR